MRPILGALVALLAVSTQASADDTSLLYRATAIVTGIGEENRQIGFRLCMEDAIVRVSGDYRLVASGKAAATIADAAGFVTKFTYRDRMEGIPIHDEQGSYARPHDLTVDFDRARLDAALHTMSARPWLTPRPTLTIVLGVKNATSQFVLSADGEQGFYMRDSFTASSDRIAVPIAFPSRALIDGAGLAAAEIGSADIDALGKIAIEAGGDQVLAGTLTWSDAERGWIADWRLGFEGRTNRWRVSGVSFDDAFRNALRGAAQVLSGNGESSG